LVASTGSSESLSWATPRDSFFARATAWVSSSSGLMKYGAGVGQTYGAAGASEELEPKLFLKLLDLVTDGRGRQPELFRRARKIEVPGRRVEGAQSACPWDMQHHRSSKFSNRYGENYSFPQVSSTV
jgi:hypothetical protein